MVVSEHFGWDALYECHKGDLFLQLMTKNKTFRSYFRSQSRPALRGIKGYIFGYVVRKSSILPRSFHYVMI